LHDEHPFSFPLSITDAAGERFVFVAAPRFGADYEDEGAAGQARLLQALRHESRASRYGLSHCDRSGVDREPFAR
jgi:hypothetical protein